MSKTPDFIARVTDLSHRYGGTVAVDAINLQIPVGCMVGLIGPDGVGKSSLLASTLRLITSSRPGIISFSFSFIKLRLIGLGIT